MLFFRRNTCILVWIALALVLSVSSTVERESRQRVESCAYDDWSSWSHCKKSSNYCGGVKSRAMVSATPDDCPTITDRKKCRTDCLSQSESEYTIEDDDNPVADRAVSQNSQEYQTSENQSPSDAAPMRISPVAINVSIIAVAVLFVVAVGGLIIAYFTKQRIPRIAKPKKPKIIEPESEESNNSCDSLDIQLTPEHQERPRGTKGLVVGKEGKSFEYSIEELHSLQL